MVVTEARPVMCYKCGAVLGTAEAQWTQEGMARFREKAAALKREHICGRQDTRKPLASDGSR